MTTTISISSTVAARILSTTDYERDTTPDSNPTAYYVYIIIELVYLLVFAVVAYLMKRYKFMKTEDDAVTKYHRRHFDLMKKQQDELIEQQKAHENFLVASRT